METFNKFTGNAMVVLVMAAVVCFSAALMVGSVKFIHWCLA